MSQTIVEVRGHKIAVQSVSGSQTAFIIAGFEKRTDEQLAQYAEETAQIVARHSPPLRSVT